jgi:hypothetical protein
MKLYTQSEIGHKVQRIIKASQHVEGELHNVLCSILTHTAQHGDYTQLVPLMNGLANGTRKQGVIAWLKHFSGKQLIVRKDAETKQFVAQLDKGWSAEKFDLEGAYAVTFGDFTEEPEPKTLDIKALYKMLKAKAISDQTNKDGSPKVAPEARVVASRLIAAMQEMAEVKAAVGVH